MILAAGYTHQVHFARIEEHADGSITSAPCGTHPAEAQAAFAARLGELRAAGFLVLDCDRGLWVATQINDSKPFEAVKLRLVSELVNIQN